MSAARTLVRLRWLLARNWLRESGLGRRLKLLALIAFTFCLMGLEGAAARFLFNHLRSHEDLSIFFVLALVEKLLALVFLTSLTLLVFSNAITALQTLYLSRDLELLTATPSPLAAVFGIKLAETVALSSYMVVAFTLPILVGYGLSFDAGVVYYLQLVPTLIAYVLVPAGVGVAVTVLLMRFVPARRAHQALTVVALAGGISLVILLRLTRPERLLRPASELDLMQFLRAITLPAAEYLPSSWAARLQMAAIGGDRHALALNAGLLLGAAVLSLGIAFLAAKVGYSLGLQGAHDARRRTGGGPASRRIGLVRRDLLLFVRDPSQWSQLLLLGALVILYVFNITALPMDLLVVQDLRLKDLIAWLNGALAGLVLAAVGLRFVLPATSFEGGAFWAIASSPTSRTRYVLKQFVFYLPLVLFAELLVLLANLALGVDGVMMAITLGTAALVSVALTGLGVGLGAAFPVFKLENPAQIMFSAGGVLYGVTALSYVVLVLALEARPVWVYLLAGRFEPNRALLHLAALLALSALTTVGPLLLGCRRLERLEL